MNSVKLNSTPAKLPIIGDVLSQTRADGKIAKGYAASYDQETNILKYYQDRSLYLTSGVDTTDTSEITTKGQLLSFESSANQITAGGGSGFQGSIDTSFGGSTLSLNDSIVGLGVTFSQGLAEPEINKSTGDIIYIDNRSIVTRSNRQKEDVKIILEF